jgi:uncharacterized protein (DUF342 family)
MEWNAVAFREDEGHQLHLHFSPDEGARRQPEDSVALQALAVERGYPDLAYDEAALHAAATRIRDAKAWSGVVARRSDAVYVVEVAPDKMTVWLTVVAAFGGRPAVAMDALAALRAYGISDGIDPTAVETAVRHEGQRQQVAAGTMPQPGRDGELELLVDINRRRHPHVDERGQVDLHDLGAVPTVQAGEPLMRRHPPQPGRAGCTVFGEKVPAPPVKDGAFPLGRDGVCVSPDDLNLLLAQVAGQPVLQRNGIAVEPIVRYQDVDIEVGNVQFPGSIEVRGDVRSGMKIEVGGDVVVHGLIEYAEVHAGGDIRVSGGIIGHSETSGTPTSPVRITAGGNVSAKFVENSILEAQQSVCIDESIVRSEVSALEAVVVGAKGRKGRILGSKIRATRAVATDYLGGEGVGRTQVRVGINPLLQRMLDENRERLDAKLKQHDDVSKVIKLLCGRPEKQELCEKARTTSEKLCEEIGEEVERQRLLEAEAQLADGAKIVVREAVAAGVTVSVGRRTRTTTDDMGRGAFMLGGRGEMEFVSGETEPVRPK